MLQIACPHCGARITAVVRSTDHETLCSSCGRPVVDSRQIEAAPPSAFPEGKGQLAASLVTGLVCFGGMSLLVFLYWRSYGNSPIFAFPFFGLLGFMPGVLIGYRSLSRPGRKPMSAGAWMTSLVVRALVFSTITSIIVAPAVILFNGAQDAGKRMSCQRQLKDLGLVYKMFANERKGVYPKLSSKPGCLMFDKDVVYPEYLKDPRVLVCPSDFTEDMWKFSPEQLVTDRSYFYLGYAVSNDEEVETFCETYRQRLAAGQLMDGDITVPKGRGSNGGAILYRLCEGVERLLVTDINDAGAANSVQSSLPILIERFSRRWFKAAGGNVLFMDGHVEFRSYPGAWPMTEKTVQALEQIHALQQEQK